MNNVRLDSKRIPRARGSGRVRDGNGIAATSQFDPVIANVLPIRSDLLATRIAANQADELDQLSLIGYPTSFDEQTRDVVETALRLAARKVLEA